MIRVAVLSDTHGMLRQEVKDVLSSCDVILHGGDINKQEILDQLAVFAPVHVVRGNNDKEWAAELPETLRLELGGVRIFMIHNRRQIREDISECDLVIFGHSHRYLEQKEGTTCWLNPGSCGPRRFHSPVTMALLEISENGTFTIQKVELLTGEKETGGDRSPENPLPSSTADRRKLVKAVIKDTDRGRTVDEIAVRNGITRDMAEQICRLYVTHPGIDADGVLDKMELYALGVTGKKR
ncbi:MAG: metallophosphoesterase family protein [Lachnospiraceae bacterium]|nr:metallophosphoesterase family protein [Lachnospiraceae bacterium]